MHIIIVGIFVIGSNDWEKLVVFSWYWSMTPIMKCAAKIENPRNRIQSMLLKITFMRLAILAFLLISFLLLPILKVVWSTFKKERSIFDTDVIILSYETRLI